MSNSDDEVSFEVLEDDVTIGIIVMRDRTTSEKFTTKEAGHKIVEELLSKGKILLYETKKLHTDIENCVLIRSSHDLMNVSDVIDIIENFGTQASHVETLESMYGKPKKIVY